MLVERVDSVAWVQTFESAHSKLELTASVLAL